MSSNCGRSSSTTSGSRATSCASCSSRPAGSPSWPRPANGVDALALIDDHAPDLVFLDVQMPGLNGFEVARQVIEREGGDAADGGATPPPRSSSSPPSTSTRSRRSRWTPWTTCSSRSTRATDQAVAAGAAADRPDVAATGRTAGAGRRWRTPSSNGSSNDLRRDRPAGTAGGEGWRAVLAGRRRRRDFRHTGRRGGDGGGHGVHRDVQLPDARRPPGPARSGERSGGSIGHTW